LPKRSDGLPFNSTASYAKAADAAAVSSGIPADVRPYTHHGLKSRATTEQRTRTRRPLIFQNGALTGSG
jgi:hypothetical protein